MAAGAEAGQGGGQEYGHETNPPREQACPPSAAAPAAGQAGATRESVRHLNRCLGQAQPPAAPGAPPHLGLVPASPAAPLPTVRPVLGQDGPGVPAADGLAQAAFPAERISLEAEIPEALFEGMRAFIQARPDWDQYRLVTSALAGFLFQHGWADGCVSEHYLNGLFRDNAA